VIALVVVGLSTKTQLTLAQFSPFEDATVPTLLLVLFPAASPT